MTIQVEESSKCNIFICLGPLYIEMTYFAALGFLIGCPDGPSVDIGVHASRSLNGFLKGKHFNRGQRIHVLLAFAFRMQYFQYFHKQNDPFPEGCLSELTNLQYIKNPSAKQMDIL